MMERPIEFYKMKEEHLQGTLTQLPKLHPSSKHKPDLNCKQCEGTGWIIYPKGHFLLLKSTYQYDGLDSTFCACTFFLSREIAEDANEMIKETIKGLR